MCHARVFLVRDDVTVSMGEVSREGRVLCHGSGKDRLVYSTVYSTDV